jgi:hypothetical protein
MMSSRKSPFQSLVRSLSASVANAIAEWQKEQSFDYKAEWTYSKKRQVPLKNKRELDGGFCRQAL